MARESCNLDKDEAEILKASASSSSPSPSPPLPPPSPSSLYQKPPQELPAPESSGNLAVAGSGASISCEKTMSNKEPQRSGAAISCEKTMSNKEPQPPVGFINRCSSCRKRVGLTGFRCRCGDLFCAHHRYSDTHDCSFDYKAAAREQIAKANPLIRAAKIIKI